MILQAKCLRLQTKEMRNANRVLHTRIGALVLLIGALLPAPLLAHAGVGIQHLNNVPTGPYRVYVWSDPEPPEVGEYHVTVALTENVEGDTTGLAGGPVLDAFVIVEITHQQSGETLSARATHDDALNKLFYEASFAPAKQGIWSVQVRIAPPGCEDGQNGNDNGSGSPASPCQPQQVVSYQDEILPKVFPWPAVLGGLLAVALILAAGLLYWKTQPPAPEEAVRVKERDSALEGSRS